MPITSRTHNCVSVAHMNHNSPLCCWLVWNGEVLGLPCADIPPGTVGLSPEWQHTARVVNSISHFNCGSLWPESPWIPDIMVPVVSNAGYARVQRTYHHFNSFICLLSAAVGYTEKATKPTPSPNFGLQTCPRELHSRGRVLGKVEASWDQKSRASEFMGPMDLLSDRRVGVHIGTARLIAMGPELRRYSFLFG